MRRLERRREPEGACFGRKASQRCRHSPRVRGVDRSGATPDLCGGAEVPERMDREARDVLFAAMDRREHEGHVRGPKFSRESIVEPLIVDVAQRPA